MCSVLVRSTQHCQFFLAADERGLLLGEKPSDFTIFFQIGCQSHIQVFGYGNMGVSGSPGELPKQGPRAPADGANIGNRATLAAIPEEHPGLVIPFAALKPVIGGNLC